MDQIYDFQANTPPILNENMLRTRAERKKADRQMALLALAAVLLQAIALLLGWAAVDWYPWLSAVCFGYALITTIGGGIVAAVYLKIGGNPV